MTLPWLAAPALSPSQFAAVRRRTIFEHCKWDPQVGDVSALCPFPLILTPAAWQEIARLAETLAAETLAAEAELSRRPDLIAKLGLPRAVRRALSRTPGVDSPDLAEPRVMRFDFHWTQDGWRISEVNSDVPGGFIESGGFTQLMAAHYPGTRPTGDPGRQCAHVLRQSLGSGATVGLVHATAYVDDRQVMVYLGRYLERQGLACCLVSPADLTWRDGRAHFADGGKLARSPFHALLRFFPAEWLPNLPSRCRWDHFFAGARLPLCNPGRALLSQSKRFPLVWDRLETQLPTWRALLPETRDPRRVAWGGPDDDWVLKPALGRVGEDIGLSGVTPPKLLRKLYRAARWWPWDWAAQRRFRAVPLHQDGFDYYPVLGVYVIGGRSCGIYGRVARRPLIDFQAQDIAVLNHEIHERYETEGVDHEIHEIHETGGVDHEIHEIHEK